MTTIPDSYEDYLHLVKASGEMSMHQLGRDIIQRVQRTGAPTSRFAPVAYLVDYSRGQYIYVDEACFDLFGYTAQEFKEGGLQGYIQKWHPQDYQIINANIFPASLAFLQDIPLNRYQDFVFTYNYRVLNGKGEYISVLQRSSFIPSNTPGKPLGNLGVAFEITHFKNELSVIHTIEEVKYYNGQLTNELLYKKVYNLQKDIRAIVSRRELEIVKWMAEGFSSKQIAQSLGISLNTVNNHRKNMLHKTGCRSSTELLNYLLRYGYL